MKKIYNKKIYSHLTKKLIRHTASGEYFVEHGKMIRYEGGRVYVKTLIKHLLNENSENLLTNEDVEELN